MTDEQRERAIAQALKERKIKQAKWGIPTVIVLVWLLFNAAVGFKDCFTIVFDKWAVMQADTIVIIDEYEGNNLRVTITDKDLVRAVAKETLVATKTNLCSHSHGETKYRKILLYKDGRVVREMSWSDDISHVRVYSVDLGHWVFLGDGYGSVTLSRDLRLRLEAVMENQ